MSSLPPLINLMHPCWINLLISLKNHFQNIKKTTEQNLTEYCTQDAKSISISWKVGYLVLLIRGTEHTLLCPCRENILLYWSLSVGKTRDTFPASLEVCHNSVTVNAGAELLSTRLQHETTDESAQFLHYACLQRGWLPLQLGDGIFYLFVMSRSHCRARWNELFAALRC